MLILAGENDKIREEHTRYLASKIPNSRLVFSRRKPRQLCGNTAENCNILESRKFSCREVPGRYGPGTGEELRMMIDLTPVEVTPKAAADAQGNEKKARAGSSGTPTD